MSSTKCGQFIINMVNIEKNVKNNTLHKKEDVNYSKLTHNHYYITISDENDRNVRRKLSNLDGE